MKNTLKLSACSSSGIGGSSEIVVNAVDVDANVDGVDDDNVVDDVDVISDVGGRRGSTGAEDALDIVELFVVPRDALYI